jgi:hypothetical protein
MRTFFIWSNQLTSGDDVNEVERDLGFERMMVMLGDGELSMKKSENIKQTCMAELQEYSQIFEGIEKKIEESKVMLEQLKSDLVVAKAERKNKAEANDLCKIIEEFPSRDATNLKLIKVKEDIEAAKLQNIELMEKHARWLKKFELVLGAVGELDKEITEEPETEPMDTLELETVSPSK